MLASICKYCKCGILWKCFWWELPCSKTDRLTTALQMHLKKNMFSHAWETRCVRKVWNERKVHILKNIHSQAKSTWLLNSLNIQLYLKIFGLVGCCTEYVGLIPIFEDSARVKMSKEYTRACTWNFAIPPPLFVNVIGLLFFFLMALRPNVGHGLLILEVSGSHRTTHHSR